MIVAEGDIPAGGVEDGVLWRRFAFEGYLLAGALKREIATFAPDALYVINVRTKPMRAALELHVALGSRIAVQSEDDDLLIFEKFYRNPDRSLLELLDKPRIGNHEIREFLVASTGCIRSTSGGARSTIATWSRCCASSVTGLPACTRRSGSRWPTSSLRRSTSRPCWCRR